MNNHLWVSQSVCSHLPIRTTVLRISTEHWANPNSPPQVQITWLPASYGCSARNEKYLYNPQALAWACLHFRHTEFESWWLKVAQIKLRADRLFLRGCNESSVVRGKPTGLAKLTQIHRRWSHRAHQDSWAVRYVPDRPRWHFISKRQNSLTISQSDVRDSKAGSVLHRAPKHNERYLGNYPWKLQNGFSKV